jgi:hypothetical protein
MKHFYYLQAIAIVFFMMNGLLVKAEEEVKEPVTVSIYVDNDLFTSGNKDEDYTGGFALTYSGAKAANHPFSIDKALSWANDLTGASTATSNDDRNWHSCEVGLAAFTPTDLDSQQPISNDRPYAGLLYLSNAQQTVNEKNRSALISTLTVGFLGIHLTADVQNTIHKVIGSRKTKGWDNQISEGGEPTFKYSLTWQKYPDLKSQNLQAVTSLGMSIGYLTEAVAGASFRFGKIHTPWWSFNVHNSNYGEKSNVTLPTSDFKDELYGVVGANMKLRIYNALLQGQFRDSKVTYSSSELEPLVFETWVGVGSEFNSGLRLSYLLRYQTSELKTGLSDRAFGYGEIVASYKF